jgi:hypothetical protein
MRRVTCSCPRRLDFIVLTFCERGCSRPLGGAAWRCPCKPIGASTPTPACDELQTAAFKRPFLFCTLKSPASLPSCAEKREGAIGSLATLASGCGPSHPRGLHHGSRLSAMSRWGAASRRNVIDSRAKRWLGHTPLRPHCGSSTVGLPRTLAKQAGRAASFADRDFNRPALHPADPIKCQMSTQTPR